MRGGVDVVTLDYFLEWRLVLPKTFFEAEGLIGVRRGACEPIAATH